MILFKSKISEQGFTLMELVVTVAIISIMSAVYLVNYRATDQRIVLDQAAAGLASDIRLAQNMAMNVKKFNGVIPVGGYGIHIGSLPAVSYIVFADVDAGYNKKYSSSAEKYADRTLPTNVSIVSANFTGDIDFEPPFPVVWIDGAQTANMATITIQYGTSGSTRVITVNRLTGQVNIN